MESGESEFNICQWIDNECVLNLPNIPSSVKVKDFIGGVPQQWDKQKLFNLFDRKTACKISRIPLSSFGGMDERV